MTNKNMHNNKTRKIQFNMMASVLVPVLLSCEKALVVGISSNSSEGLHQYCSKCRFY